MQRDEMVGKKKERNIREGSNYRKTLSLYLDLYSFRRCICPWVIARS